MALVIFDLDGTLVDSIDGIAISMNMVLNNLGYPEHSVNTYKNFVGHGIKKLVEQALPDEASKDEVVSDIAYKAMLESYGKHYDRGLKVYDGIYEILDRLSYKGHKLAILTNKHQSMAEPIVEKYFGQYDFCQILGRHESRPKKPDPHGIYHIMKHMCSSPQETYFVGDSEVDLMTAQNAEVLPIIVNWGFRDLDTLKSHGAENIITEPKEILNCIKDRR